MSRLGCLVQSSVRSRSWLLRLWVQTCCSRVAATATASRAVNSAPGGKAVSTPILLRAFHRLVLAANVSVIHTHWRAPHGRTIDPGPFDPGSKAHAILPVNALGVRLAYDCNAMTTHRARHLANLAMRTGAAGCPSLSMNVYWTSVGHQISVTS